MYQVLYRKWRPRSFRDVSGQGHITSTLQKEIMSDKISHAYLFTGSRGTGKTTCAKIFSKAVNCLHPVDGNPCNECEICRGIDDGTILDVIELDAASNNGVDNIREIIEESGFTPVNAKYRVYIIDEVHMLSTGAFNALLKTLEEPPEHVKFILATTEVHKIPSTILSRCQRFDFRRITPEDISERIKYVASQEGISITDDACLLISRIADGALRDALSLLDRCSGTGEEIDSRIVSDAAGLAGKDYLFRLVDSIKNNDVQSSLSIVNDLHNNSCDMERLCTELLNHYRNLMIVKTVKNPEQLIICIDDDMALYKNQASSVTLQSILFCISVLENSLVTLKTSINKRIGAEMAIVKLCSPEASSAGDMTSVIARIEKIEEKLNSGSFIASKISSSDVKNNEDKKDIKESKAEAEKLEENKTAPEIKQDSSPAEAKTPGAPSPGNNDSQADEPFTLWGDVISEIHKTDVPLTGILTGSFAFIRGDHLLIKCDNPTFPQFIRTQVHAAALREAVTKVSGRKYRLGIYKASDNAQKKQDPLQDLVNKINKFNQ